MLLARICEVRSLPMSNNTQLHLQGKVPIEIHNPNSHRGVDPTPASSYFPTATKVKELASRFCFISFN